MGEQISRIKIQLLALGERLARQAEHSGQEIHEPLKFRVQENGQPQHGCGCWILDSSSVQIEDDTERQVLSARKICYR